MQMDSRWNIFSAKIFPFLSVNSNSKEILWFRVVKEHVEKLLGRAMSNFYKRSSKKKFIIIPGTGFSKF